MSENPRNEFISSKLEELIQCLAGANSTTAERRTLEQFAAHKIRHHRNVSVNSHEVRRTIDNLVDRFEYEGMRDQADAVRELSTLIIEHPLWQDHYELDIQFSVLDFIFSLIYAPVQHVSRNRIAVTQRLLAIKADLETASDDKEAADELKTSSSNDTIINWGARLKEHNFLTRSQSACSESSLSDWSDNSMEDELPSSGAELAGKTSLPRMEMASVYAKAKEYPGGSNTFVPDASRQRRQRNTRFKINQPQSLSFSGKQTHRVEWCTLPALPTLEPPKALCHFNSSVGDVNHLPKRIFSQCSLSDFGAESNDNPADNFAIAYVQHLNYNLPILFRHELPIIMNETALLREIIFMFFRPASGFFFEFEPKQQLISVRDNVSIPNVSTSTMKSTLELEVLPALQAMQQLRSIIKAHTLFIDYEESSGTLECFATALRDLLQPIRDRLIHYERQLLRDLDSKNIFGLEMEEELLRFTLVGFVVYMRKQFKQLLQLQSLTTAVVVVAPAYISSPFLLCQLYQLSIAHVGRDNIALALLLVALRRYCVIMDNWWQRAVLDDLRNEYIVEANSSNDSSCPTHLSLRERLLLFDDEHEKVIEQLQSSPFYQLLVDHALEACETQDLLSSVNLLDELVDARQQLPPLHADLTKQLFEELLSCDDNNTLAVHSSSSSAPNEYLKQQKQLLKRLCSVGNPELIGIFSQRMTQRAERKQLVTPQPAVFKTLQGMERCLQLQRPHVLSVALVKVLRQRCELANVFAMRWYREELKLGEHVRFLRHIMLLEADYLLYPFYTKVFGQIELGQDWARHSLLNWELYDILDEHYHNLAIHLHVLPIKSICAASPKVYEALEAIELRYDMPPALQRIISEQHMAQYNAIWRLIVKVKWAAWKLQNMSFIRRAPKDTYAPLDLLGLTVRRLEIVRFWLIYIINSVHLHLCTHVLESVEGLFEQQLNKSSNIRELCSLHDKYLKKLFIHLLLSNDFVDLRAALEQVFHLIFVLAAEWTCCASYLNESHALSLDISTDSDTDNSNTDDFNTNTTSERSKGLEYLALNQVADLETSYIRCHEMMATILTDLVYKQDHKFLNSLEVAINSSIPG